MKKIPNAWFRTFCHSKINRENYTVGNYVPNYRSLEIDPYPFLSLLFSPIKKSAELVLPRFFPVS
jgi:hypothetical protein